MRILKPTLIGTGVGFGVGVIVFLVVVLTSFGPSENAFFVQLVFPFAADTNRTSNAWVILSLLFLQYPLYGALMGIASNSKRHRTVILLALLALIIGGHNAAVRSARHADAMWVASQGGE